MYMLTILDSSNPNTNVFRHPIDEDRITDVVRIVMKPQEGATPEKQLLDAGRISQRHFRKLVKDRAEELAQNARPTEITLPMLGG